QRSCWERWGLPSGCTIARASCQAASSSGWRWPARSLTSPSWCLRTSRPATWTKPPPTRCWTNSCGLCEARAAPRVSRRIMSAWPRKWTGSFAYTKACSNRAAGLLWLPHRTWDNSVAGRRVEPCLELLGIDRHRFAVAGDFDAAHSGNLDGLALAVVRDLHFAHSRDVYGHIVATAGHAR